jgi:hypothetical protein
MMTPPDKSVKGRLVRSFALGFAAGILAVARFNA